MRYRLNDLFQVRVSTLELSAFENSLKGEKNFEEAVDSYLQDPAHSLALEHATSTLFEQIKNEGRDLPLTSNLRHAVYRYLNRNANRTTPFGLFVGHRAYVNDKKKGGLVPSLKKLSTLRVAPSGRMMEMKKEQLGITAKTMCAVNATLVDYEGYYLWTSIDDAESGVTRNSRLKKTNALSEIIRWYRTQSNPSVPILVDYLCDKFPSQNRKDVAHFVNRLVDIGFLQVYNLSEDSAECLFPVSLFPSSAEVFCGARDWLREDREKAQILGSELNSGVPVGQELFSLELNSDAEIHLADFEIESIENAIETVLVTSLSFPELHYYMKKWQEKFIEHYGVANYVPLKRAINPLAGIGPVFGYMNPVPINNNVINKLDLWTKEDLDLRLKMLRKIRKGKSHVPYVDLGQEDFSKDLSSLKKKIKEQNVYPTFDFSFQVGTNRNSSKVFMMHSDACALGGHTFARLLDSMDGGTSQVFMEVLAQLAKDKQSCRSFGLLAEPLTLSSSYLVPRGGFAEEYVDSSRNVGALSLDDLYLVSDGENVEVVANDDYSTPIRFNLPSLLIPFAFSNEARFLLDISRSEYKISAGFSWCQLEGSDFLPEVRFNETVLRPAEWRIVKQLQQVAKQANKLNDYRELRQCLLDWGVSGIFVLAAEDNRLYFDVDSDISLKSFSIALKKANENDVIEKSSFYACRGVWFNTRQGVKRLSTELICSVSRKIGGRASNTVSPVFVRHDLRNLPDEDWMSITLVTAPTAMDELIKVVGGFCSQDERVLNWFYVRYNDFGTSLRVRIRIADKHEKYSDFLQDFIAVVKNSALINRWYLSEYVPEIARYSDGEALKVVHEAFSISTELALAYVCEIETNEDMSLTSAAANLIAYATLIGVQPSWLLERLPKERPSDEARQVWRENVDDLVSQYEELAFYHLRKNEIVFSRLRDMHSDDGDERVAQIILDLLHMHCNRLKGSGDSFEADMLWILQRCFYKITVLQRKEKFDV